MDDPKIFEDGIDPSDIKQGIIPDCWFLSACACLAERPSLIRRLFITQEYNKEGIYRLRILKNGEWQLVTIDDYIPCYYNGGPMFTRSNGMELWVMLLEKAYAKLHGNYNCLEYGYTYEGMIDLTGCPTTFYDLRNSPSLNMDRDDDRDYLWRLMENFDQRGFLISGETPGYDEYTKEGGLSGGGLVPGHAYSIIRFVEVEGNRIVNIYNPWGKFEWDGDWSDNDSKWTREIKEIVQPTLKDNDGLFWMSYDDFLKRFSSMNVCQLKDWEEIRVRGKFLKVEDADEDFIDGVISKFYYEIQVPKKTKITALILKIKYSKQYKNYF